MPSPDILPPETQLLVCVTCGGKVAEGETRPGAQLYDRLSEAGLPDGVTAVATECLSNCSRGCTVALRGGPARWTYVYGNLDPDSHIDTLVEGVARYHATADGLVPWRERSEYFRKNCIVRLPPMEPADV